MSRLTSAFPDFNTLSLVSKYLYYLFFVRGSMKRFRPWLSISSQIDKAIRAKSLEAETRLEDIYSELIELGYKHKFGEIK